MQIRTKFTHTVPFVYKKFCHFHIITIIRRYIYIYINRVLFLPPNLFQLVVRKLEPCSEFHKWSQLFYCNRAFIKSFSSIPDLSSTSSNSCKYQFRLSKSQNFSNNRFQYILGKSVPWKSFRTNVFIIKLFYLPSYAYLGFFQITKPHQSLVSSRMWNQLFNTSVNRIHFEDWLLQTFHSQYFRGDLCTSRGTDNNAEHMISFSCVSTYKPGEKHEVHYVEIAYSIHYDVGSFQMSFYISKISSTKRAPEQRLCCTNFGFLINYYCI